MNATQDITESSMGSLHKKRLYQIFSGFVALLFSLAFVGYITEYYFASIITLLTTIPLFSVYILLRLNKFTLAANTLLLILLVLPQYMLWMFHGLRDEAIFAVPALLIIGIFIGSQRAFFILLTLSVINILTIGYVNETGIYLHEQAHNSFSASLIWATICLFIAFGISVLGLDLQRYSFKLQRENQQAIALSKRAEYLLKHNILTNLPNEKSAHQKFTTLSASTETLEHIKLLLIDIDNFKHVNDSLGHSFGDQYLIEIANRLQLVSGNNNAHCYHIGGDRFLVLYVATQQEQLTQLLRAIHGAVEQPFEANNINVASTISIGISAATTTSKSFHDLALNAQVVVDIAKEQSKNCDVIYSDDIKHQRETETQLGNDLRGAIANNELSISFQPRISLAKNQIIGAEAFLEWHHPQQGIIESDKLMHIAENSSAVYDIADWLINNACNACNNWVSQGYDIPVSISTSIQQFNSGKIIESVERNLMFTELNGSHLELQVTEGLFADESPTLQSTLSILKSMGIKLIIDDFGIGYSNLSNLNDYDVSALKIDKTFTHDICHNTDDRIIVNAMIQIAKSLNIEIIAEGISDPSALGRLHKLGSNAGQGDLWCEPLSEDKFISYLQEYTSEPMDKGPASEETTNS